MSDERSHPHDRRRQHALWYAGAVLVVALGIAVIQLLR